MCNVLLFIQQGTFSPWSEHMPSKGGAHHQNLPSRNPQDTPPVASMMIPPNFARPQQTIFQLIEFLKISPQTTRLPPDSWPFVHNVPAKINCSSFQSWCFFPQFLNLGIEVSLFGFIISRAFIWSLTWTGIERMRTWEVIEYSSVTRVAHYFHAW